MTVRTFRRADLDAANLAWADGDFSDEWRPYRHQAAMLGMIYPPEGTRWDSWEDDQPSQRAMLIRAIRETPALLSKCIAKSHSWGQVIALLVKERDDWRARQAQQERFDEGERDEPDPREATVTIKRILERIGDS